VRLKRVQFGLIQTQGNKYRTNACELVQRKCMCLGCRDDGVVGMQESSLKNTFVRNPFYGSTISLSPICREIGFPSCGQMTIAKGYAQDGTRVEQSNSLAVHMFQNNQSGAEVPFSSDHNSFEWLQCHNLPFSC
jgi:hypothetical protein